MRTTGCLLWAVGVTCALAAPVLADGDQPALRSGAEIRCLTDRDGLRWRVQCDEATRTCLFAPDSEVDEAGRRMRPLARTTRSCAVSGGTFDRFALATEGMKLVPARADAPYGWTRDERGRVFQTSFDLHKRLWVGASYAPTDEEHGRFAFDVSLLELELFVPGARTSGTRHRLRLATGEVRIAPFSTNAVLFHYDMSRRYENPLLRITTFLGRPRRHDLDLSLGWWLEAGDLEVHEAPAGDEILWRIGTLQATLDLWQSADIGSYVRVRGGAGVERTAPARPADAKLPADTEARVALTPSAALEAHFELDRDGFHHVTALASWEAPLYVSAPVAAGDGARRLRGELGYEVIILAVNDQPITLRLGGAAVYRDDIPGLPAVWSFSATAGLRFSLWAPAPVPLTGR